MPFVPDFCEWAVSDKLTAAVAEHHDEDDGEHVFGV